MAAFTPLWGVTCKLAGSLSFMRLVHLEDIVAAGTVALRQLSMQGSTVTG